MQSYKLYESRKIHDLRDLLKESVKKFPRRVAFYQKVNKRYKPISYIDFYNDVLALGTALVARGYKGKKIILLGENCYSWCLSYMSIACGVGVIVPTDKELPCEEVANVARVCGAAAIIYSKKYENRLSLLDDKVRRIAFEDIGELIVDGSARISACDRRYTERSVNADAMCALIFTSGTTGVSKGVMLSHRNICTNVSELAKMIRITPEDIALSVLPLHHVYECNCGFLGAISRGAAYAFCEGVRYVTRNAKEIHPTKILCVPLLIGTIYKKIWSEIRKKGIENKVKTIIKLTDAVYPISARLALKKKLFFEIHESFGGKLDLLISGGAPIDPEIIKGMRSLGFHVIQGYGLTECAPLAALNHDRYFNDASAGLALPGGELRIAGVSEDGTGEIIYRGDNVMLGYFGDDELTERTVKDGWLYTGDVGYIDDKGFLIITGRKKNVIVTSNGKNIFPEELEAYLCRSIFVKEAVVCGIMNKRKNDYDIVAAVRPDRETARMILGENYSEDELKSRIYSAVDVVNETVQSYKQIDVCIITDDEFPKNSTNKIRRNLVNDFVMADYLMLVGQKG